MVIVQSLWVGTKLSRMEYYSILSFIKQGYTFHLYTYNEVANIPFGTIIKDANEILPIKEIFSLKGSYLPYSDIWRYKLLYLKGGYWCDLDMICLKRFDTDDKYIISSEHTMQSGAYKSKLPYVSNIGILKAPIGSLMFKNLYEKCSKYQTKNKNIDKLKYMKIFRNYVNKYGFNEYIKPPEYFCPLSWWNAEEAFKSKSVKKWNVNPLSDEDILNNSYTIHFWRDKVTKTYKLDLDEIYNENSLWEKSIKKILD